ncbi:MAG: LD-carboxypeptidase [Saprospiraceae bacterium]
MNRRSFNQAILGSALILPNTLSMEKSKSSYLLPGDHVGLVCPASPITEERLNKAILNMESLGLVPVRGKNILKQNGYLAGSDQERLQDLYEMYKDPSIKAIWCIRGGYGVTHLLPYMDYKLVGSNPKLLIGYSDITGFHNAFYSILKMTNLHGPMASSDFTPYTVEQLKKVIFGNRGDSIQVRTCDENDIEFTTNGKSVFERYVIHPGQAEGVLVGGNLSLLAAMCGTPYFKIKKHCILFIEDIEEAPYRVDRMITQLLQVMDTTRIKGILLGVFDGCERKDPATSSTLKEMMIERLAPLQIPCAYGFSFGHISNQCTIPLGAHAKMDSKDFSLQFELP